MQTIEINPKLTGSLKTHSAQLQTPTTKHSNSKNVFSAGRTGICDRCKCSFAKSDIIHLNDARSEIRCQACAGLGNLEYLPSGDTALTRRAVQHSERSFVVWYFNKGKNRSERRGVLVEPAAIEKARALCSEDEDRRVGIRMKSSMTRDRADAKFRRRFAAKIREMFPSCPVGVEDGIAAHACEKSSGRVGRSAAAKRLSPETIMLAVRAHIRHCETRYDKILATHRKDAAREMVRDQVDEVASIWRIPAEQHEKPPVLYGTAVTIVMP